MTDPSVHTSVPPADTELAASGFAADDDHIEVIRYEERPSVTTVRVPYRRLRIGKRVVTETKTISVEVRHEEFVYYDVGLPDPAPQDASAASPVPAEIILREEQVVVTRVVVPVERIRVVVDRVDAAVDVTIPVAHEELDFS